MSQPIGNAACFLLSARATLSESTRDLLKLSATFPSASLNCFAVRFPNQSLVIDLRQKVIGIPFAFEFSGLMPEFNSSQKARRSSL